MLKMWKKVLLLFCGSVILHFNSQAETIRVGSKKFTESVILGEIAHLWMLDNDLESVHKKEIGGTKVLWNALLRGEIDIYPEYSGTLFQDILQMPEPDWLRLQEILAEKGLGISRPLGFNNTYVLGVKREVAEKYNLKKISDLKKHPKFRAGFGEEFFNRPDGWQGLKDKYKLNFENLKILDHDLAYRGLDSGDLEVVDIYSTDPDVKYYDLFMLEDDLRFFPKYQALYIYNLKKTEALEPFIKKVEGKLPEQMMIALNHESKINKKTATEVASQWLNQHLGTQISTSQKRSLITWNRFIKRTIEHLQLVVYSLIMAILFAIPLGILAYKVKWLGEVILSIVSIVQTIPALALLVLLIQPLHFFGIPGIGPAPALVALFLYSLLPIVGNTYTGLKQIPPSLKEVMIVLNLPFHMRLLKVELPLAMPAIITGIKISAVLNVGFATLGALVGAGGYGQLILTGIRLDDFSLILQGAVPAAVLAIFLQLFFEFLYKKCGYKRLSDA